MVMKRTSPVTQLGCQATSTEEAQLMLYAGLDLSRKRLDVHVLREDGTTALVTAVSPDTDALRTLAGRVAAEGEPVRATIESMNGARFVHDSLEFAGWEGRGAASGCIVRVAGCAAYQVTAPAPSRDGTHGDDWTWRSVERG